MNNYGLNDDYRYFEISLDSLDATSSTQAGVASTDWPWFEVAGKGPLQDVAAIKILEVQVPFSWYVFNSVNNTFILRIDGLPDSVVTIPVGNYTAASLAPVLTDAINAAAGGVFYTVTYSVVKKKFLFQKFAGPGFEFRLVFGAPAGIPGVQPNSGNRNPRLWLGFPPGTTTSSGGFIEAPNCDLVSGPNYLYVNSNRIGSDVDMYLPQGAFNLGGGKAGPQLAKISVDVNPGGIVIWKDPDPQKWFTFDQLQTLNSFDFYLSLGNTTSELPLKLNGLGFSLKLGVLRMIRNSLERVAATAQNGRISQREGPKRLRK